MIDHEYGFHLCSRSRPDWACRWAGSTANERINSVLLDGGVMKKVALIRGDGTGAELVDAMMLVIKASGANAEFISCDAGSEWWEQHGKGPSFVPEETWKVLDSSDCCFKGPTTTLPTPGTPRSVAISIRQRFNLYANVRPVK